MTAAGVATGDAGLAAIIDALGVDLPGAAEAAQGDALSGISGLIGNVGGQTGLLGTQDPFRDTTNAIGVVGEAFETFAQNLTGDAGFTSALTGAVPSLVETFKEASRQPILQNWDQGAYNEESGWLWTLYGSAGNYIRHKYSFNTPAPTYVYGAGGLTSGIGIAGEKGPEWVVPTYEPQRSSFLNSAPDDFWENLSSGMSGGSGGDIHLTIEMDGKAIAQVVAKRGPNDAEYTGSIEKIVRRMN